MYVGKKLAITTVKKPPLKGQKRKRKVVKETDWRKYWGSSAALLNDIMHHGEGNFHREIMHLCETKSEMAYREAEEQFNRRVLDTDMYYNGIIHCRINKSK